LAYSEIHLKSIPEEYIGILIAELGLIGYSGYEELENEIKAYIETDAYSETDLLGLIKKYKLEDSSFSLSELPKINWNKEWESNYDPVIIDDRVVIKASFHTIENEEKYRYVIHLDPKMSFGTGHHETTTMMIQEMMSLDLKGKNVLDFGSGTGVLAIMAHLLKATDIEAVDHEDWAVENAKENFEKNHCSTIHLEKSDAKYLADQQYDLILANVNRTAILENLTAFSKCLKPSGKILFSGILEVDAESVIKQSRLHSLKLVRRMKMNKWALLSMIKNT